MTEAILILTTFLGFFWGVTELNSIIRFRKFFIGFSPLFKTVMFICPNFSHEQYSPKSNQYELTIDEYRSNETTYWKGSFHEYNIFPRLYIYLTTRFSFFDDCTLSSTRTLSKKNSSRLFLLLNLLLFVSLNLYNVHFRCSEKDDTSKWKYVVRGDARCEYHGIL